MKKFLLSVKNEMLKQKRGVALLIVLLVPIAMAGINFIDLFLRYDWLKKIYKLKTSNSWDIMLLQNHFLWAFFLSLSIVVITGIIHYTESINGGWKYALSLPVNRKIIYISKWCTNIILGFSMIFLHIVFLWISGNILGFKEPWNLNLFLTYALHECMAILGMLSFQMFINSKLKNILVAMTIGFIGVICSYFFAQSLNLARVIPYTYEIYTLPVKAADIDISVSLYGGLIAGLIMLLIGIVNFSRKDIF